MEAIILIPYQKMNKMCIRDRLYTDIGICHRKVHVSDANRNLRIFEAMLDKGKKLNPREQFYYARELYYHKRYNCLLYTSHYVLKRSDTNRSDCIRYDSAFD